MTYIIDNLWARLHNLVPNPKCATYYDDYDLIIWKDDREKPSKEALESVDSEMLKEKELRYNKLLLQYNNKISNGMPFRMSNGTDIVVQCRKSDLESLKNISVKNKIRTKDNEIIDITSNDFDRLTNEISVYLANLLEKLWDFKDKINNAYSVQELNNIEIKF